MQRASFVIGVWLLVGCGGGLDENALVVELSTPDQEVLCEDFLDDICANPDSSSFCDDPCIASACPAAVDEGAVDAQCGGGVTVGMVEDCAATFDFAICVEGGGCMFDALESVCP